MTIRPIRTLMNHATTEIFLDGVVVPDEDLVGEEGRGFRYILDGMNAERVLIAAECIGDGRWFVEKATAYASERVVFGRPIGANQGVQFPIARAHAADRGGRPDALQGGLALRAGPPVRRRGEHGEAARRRGVLGRRPTPASTRTAASASRRSTTSSGSSARRGSTRSRRSRTTSSSPTSASTCSACRGATTPARSGSARADPAPQRSASQASLKSPAAFGSGEGARTPIANARSDALQPLGVEVAGR